MDLHRRFEKSWAGQTLEEFHGLTMRVRWKLLLLLLMLLVPSENLWNLLVLVTLLLSLFDSFQKTSSTIS